ncbi:formylmethanofuran dehydrogenase subunit A [Methanococcus voltae]|uniref:Formylmethanofuran dehydrogenase subunit A n=1 Tax=Methanococcus voltae (strain ATCC BAA-1334 / A3) TaxID=456320 RepID=D7DTE0_METV3|nr:formylmethanofuran dehydrogenase subunit A [Methanococcus voltae]MCS3901251.1 formylmethanofuran dehydrogenase subunit A [Methanococcus voltae]
MTKMIIKGGHVYDPLNGVDGEVMDIYIKDGKIVESLSSDEIKEAKILDAKNKVVMAGGVDAHTHIAGPKVTIGRVMFPEDHYKCVREKTYNTHCGTGEIVPSTYMQGYKYATMGYTTTFEAAVPPMIARHTHEELKALPILDKAGYLLLGNNWFVMKYLREGDIEKAAAYVAWALDATKTYGIKCVNPAGVENWAWGKNVNSLDEKNIHFDVSARQIVDGLAQINEMLGLPMSIHLHANNLGHPGNWEITKDTMDVTKNIKVNVKDNIYNEVKTKFDSRRKQSVYMTHVQFHSFGGTSWKDFESKADDVSKHVNKSDHVVIDSGCVPFGKAICMTGDGPGLYDIATMNGQKWTNCDVELECGSGIVPFNYSIKNKVHSVQWAIGLELLLLVDPAKAILTTDNPNAGPFTKYPKIMRWLLSNKARQDTMKECHKWAAERSTLESIDKELNLYELAQITRSTPAIAIGMGYRKGHLGAGADADVTIYDITPDYNSNDYEMLERVFTTTAYTIKDGQIVSKGNEIVETPSGRSFFANVAMKDEIQKPVMDDVKDFFKYYTVGFNNYSTPEEYLTRPTPMDIDLK